MPLTDAKLRSLKPGEKPYKVSDGSGLHVLVNTTGSRLWRLAYRFKGKQKALALGAYPDVSLSDARERREAARKLLRAGADPGQARKVEKRQARIASGETFRLVGDEWFESQKARWVPGYAARLQSRLDADLYPALGDRPISVIEPMDVLDAIRAIEKRGAVEMGRRVLQMASAIFRYGVATSRCVRDPTADLRGALRARPPVKHRAALRHDELPEFLARLDAYDGESSTRLALTLVAYTFVRTKEIRFAHWAEFEDLGGSNPVWRIPAERMKMRREHLVPISIQTAKTLEELRQHAGKNAALFPAATRSGVISENTMIFALYRMGYHGRATVHGFRSTASTVLNENHFNRDWIELQLAHDEDNVRAAYNAAEWLPGRREMMQWWADYLDECRSKGFVLSHAEPAKLGR